MNNENPKLGWYLNKEMIVFFNNGDKYDSKKGIMRGFDSYFLYITTFDNSFCIPLSSIQLIKAPNNSDNQEYGGRIDG